MASAEYQFEKALYVLDAGRLQRGEELLQDAITKAETGAPSFNDSATLIRALCVLGELYFDNSLNDDARPLLERCVALALAREDDLCEDEKRMAQETLGKMNGAESD